MKGQAEGITHGRKPTGAYQTTGNNLRQQINLIHDHN